MIEWLKTTIPGIILLGALGSVLAVGLLKVTAVAISRFLRPATKSVLGRAFVFLRSPHYVVEYLRSSSTDIRELIVTCTFLLASVVFACEFIVIGILIMVVSASLDQIKPGTHFSDFSLFFGSFLFFSGIILGKKILGLITQVYDIYMKRAEDDAAAKARDEFRRKAKSG
jgi:hypothetical protein